MKIHQITHLFQPDSLGGAALYTDLARFLRDAGHDVRVTTTFSYYPRLHYSEQDRKAGVRDEIFEGIPMRRVPMLLPRRHQGWRRLIPEATYLLRLRTHGRFNGWRPDVVLTACPMLAQPLAAQGLYRSSKVPIILIVQDLMSAAALQLGIIRQPALGKVLVAAEHRALNGVEQIVAIAEGLKERLRAQVASGREIEVIPNWIHESLQAEADRSPKIPADRLPLVLFYSGNLGVKQGLADFLENFASVRGAWTLQLHGDGAEAAKLHAFESSDGGTSLGPLLPEPAYVDALCGAAACLITQRKDSGDSFLPSKLLPALACGKPVLAICDRRSPLGQEVESHGFGVVLPPEDRESLSRLLRRWEAAPEERLALSARASLRADFFHRERILPNYERLLTDVITRHKKRSSPP